MAERIDGRRADQVRPVKITRSFLRHAEGSALIEMGKTVVLCSATVDESVPKFLKGTGRGWVTAEYGMLPRSAAITGSFLALYDAVQWLRQAGRAEHPLIRDFIAAISVGIVQGTSTLDLCYEEDSTADVDMNLVMTGSGHLVEVQGTAEHHPFTTAQLHEMLDLGWQGIAHLIAMQKAALGLPADATL